MPYYRSYELKGEGGLWMTSLAEKLRTMEMFQSPEFRQTMMQPECISRLHGRLCLQPEGNAAPARDKAPPTLPSRQGQTGHHRGVLNTMYQNGVITKPEIRDIEHRSEGGGVTGYTGIVKFRIVSEGQEMEFRDRGGSKSAAHESTAQWAVNAIQSKIATTSATSMALPNHTSTPMSTKSKVMLPTKIVSPPKAAISTPPKVMPATRTTMSPPKDAVTALKEYCEKEKLELQYCIIPLDREQHFQYKVTVTNSSTPMESTGDICGSKQKAKQSAAQSALWKLGIL